MALGGSLDDLVFCEILKQVDVSCLMNCRLVSRSWNNEILRLNRYTKKIPTNSIIMELDLSRLLIYNDIPKSRRVCEVPIVDQQSVAATLFHLAPPKNLNFNLNWSTRDYDFCQMMDGFTDWWCQCIEELEIVTYGEVKVSKVIQYLEKFSNVVRFSFSHYCNETLSCAEIFKKLPRLRFFRIFGFNSNDGSGESSGLVFDNETIDEIIKNQTSDKRRFQRLEVFNTDILFSKSKFKEMLKKLGNSSFDLDMSTQPDIYNDPNEDVTAIHILFDNCQWESMTEQDLISTISSSANSINFPYVEPDQPDSLIGDYKFRVSNVNFVLKFTTTRLSA